MRVKAPWDEIADVLKGRIADWLIDEKANKEKGDTVELVKNNGDLVLILKGKTRTPTRLTISTL
jgi:hypothetical protein